MKISESYLPLCILIYHLLPPLQNSHFLEAAFFSPTTSGGTRTQLKQSNSKSRKHESIKGHILFFPTGGYHQPYFIYEKRKQIALVQNLQNNSLQSQDKKLNILFLIWCS